MKSSMKKNAVGPTTAVVVALVLALAMPNAFAQTNDQYGGLGGNRNNSILNVDSAFNGTEQSLAHDRSYYTSYRVYLQAGVKYQILMQSDDFRPFIWLQSGRMNISPANACVLGGRSAMIQAKDSTAWLWVQVSSSGYYDVVANTELGRQTGTYTLKIWQ